jgi:hypothetical protein
MCTAQLQAVGQAKLGLIKPSQAKPGQSHGLTAALAWLTFLESQSHQLRPWLLTEIFGTRRVYTRLSNNNFGIIPQIISIFRISQEGNQSNVFGFCWMELRMRVISSYIFVEARGCG